MVELPVLFAFPIMGYIIFAGNDGAQDVWQSAVQLQRLSQSLEQGSGHLASIVCEPAVRTPAGANVLKVVKVADGNAVEGEVVLGGHAGQTFTPEEVAARCGCEAPRPVTPAKSAGAAASSLPTGEHYVVVLAQSSFCNDIWAAAVQASALRQKVQTLSATSTPPSVVVEGHGPFLEAPVAVVTYGEAHARQVVCSGLGLPAVEAALR